MEHGVGRVAQYKRNGRGPDIWLAGDPEDLKQWLPLGTAGVVTNTVVLNQMVKKYGAAVDRPYDTAAEPPDRPMALH